MSPITAITEVDRPATALFAYATDPARFSEWQKGVVEGQMDEPGTPRVGARCRTTRRIGFTKRPTTAEVTHIDPPKNLGRPRDRRTHPRRRRSHRRSPRRQPIQHHDFDRLPGSRHRQAPRSTHRPPRSSQGDAGQPREPQGATRTTDIAGGCRGLASGSRAGVSADPSRSSPSRRLTRSFSFAALRGIGLDTFRRVAR